MRKILFLLALLVGSVAAYGQNVRYDAQFPSIVNEGTTPFLVANTPLTGTPQLAVCHSPANQVPCTNYVSTFDGLGNACPNGAQDTPNPQATTSACQPGADTQGNIGFWAPAGTYDYTICIGITCYGPYTVTLGGTGGSGGSSFYQVFQSNSSATTQRPTVNFISGANWTVSCVDDPANSRTNCTGTSTAPIANGATGFPTQYTSTAGLGISTAYIIVDGNTIGTDPCAKIATGATQLPSPGNGIIDARGLGTGNLTPCTAANAHAMFQGMTSGGIIFGNYTLWVPLSETAPAVACAAPNATSMCQPPIGIISVPNKFTGIIGAGRGDASTAVGTTIAVCKGNNNPVNLCTAPITREWTISSTSVSYVSNVPYLHIVSSGMDLTGGEPVRVRGSSKKDNDGPWRVCNKSLNNSTRTDSNCPANPTTTDVYLVGAPGITSLSISGTGNGAYNNTCTVSGGTGVQTATCTNTLLAGNIATVSITSPGRYTSVPTITVGGGSGQTVTPTLMTACASSCGIISGEIPIFDTTPLTGNQFAQRWFNLAMDCEGVLDAAGIRSLSGNEQMGMDLVKIAGCPERDIDFHQFVGQNANTLRGLELYSGTSLGNNCDVGTTAVFFGENGPHGMYDVTVNFSNCTHTPLAGIILDTNTYPLGIDKTHCENVEICYFLGQDSPAQYVNLTNDAGGPISQCGDGGTATGTVNTSGTAVTWVNGTQFNLYFPGTTINITISGTPTPFTVQSVTDATHLVLTATAGTNTGAAYTDSLGNNCVALDGAYQSGTSAVIAISPNFKGSGSPATKDYSFFTIARNTGGTNIIADWRNQGSGTTDHTSNQNSLEMYVFDSSPTGCDALITSDSGILTNFCNLSSINPITALSFITSGSNGGFWGLEGTGVNALSGTGIDTIYPDSTLHCWHQIRNNADVGCVPGIIASGSTAMTTGTIGGGACGTTVTVSAPGVATTDSVSHPTFNAAVGANPGVLIIQAWVTSGNVNFEYCNPTAGSITPSAATINWRVSR